MKFLVTIFIGSAALSFAEPIPTASPEEVGLDSKQLLKMEQFLHSYVQPKSGKQQLAGWTSALARNGKLAHFKVDGDQVLGKVPMAKDTIFRFYSMTKPITAVTLMTFWEEGRFLLDDPVELYIPAFKNMRVLRTQESPINDTVPCKEKCITIRHLLTHTSGLSYGFSPFNISTDLLIDTTIGVPPAFVSPNITLADWVDRLAKVPLVFQPGTRWHYCLSLDVCGRLVEIFSGKSFQDTVQERILDPLEMTDTGFYVPQEKRSRLGPNYAPATEMSPLVDSHDTTCVVKRLLGSGGGGLCGTTLDYLRFGLMLIGGGEFQGKRVLAPRTVRLLAANNIQFGKSITALGGVDHDMWHESHGLNGEVFDHWTGTGHGLGGMMVIDPVESGMSTGKGAYYWGGIAGTLFRVDFDEKMVGVFMIQRNDSGPPELPCRYEVMKSAAIRDIPNSAPHSDVLII